MESVFFFFFQAEDGIRDLIVTGVQTCALPIYLGLRIVKREQRQGIGDLDRQARLARRGVRPAADGERRAVLRREERLRRGQLDGLVAREMAGGQVARDRLEGRGGGGPRPTRARGGGGGA